MAPGGCLLLALLLLAGTVQGQHWSHGWYPGGKRDLSAPQVGTLRPFPHHPLTLTLSSRIAPSVLSPPPSNNPPFGLFSPYCYDHPHSPFLRVIPLLGLYHHPPSMGLFPFISIPVETLPIPHTRWDHPSPELPPHTQITPFHTGLYPHMGLFPHKWDETSS